MKILTAIWTWLFDPRADLPKTVKTRRRQRRRITRNRRVPAAAWAFVVRNPTASPREVWTITGISEFTAAAMLRSFAKLTAAGFNPTAMTWIEARYTLDPARGVPHQPRKRKAA